MVGDHTSTVYEKLSRKRAIFHMPLHVRDICRAPSYATLALAASVVQPYGLSYRLPFRGFPEPLTTIGYRFEQNPTYLSNYTL